MARYGGETPFSSGGLTITCEAPTGTTSTAPVLEGNIYKLSGTNSADSSGYKLAALGASDGPETCVMVQALHRIEYVGPVGVRVIGRYSQVRRIKYEGSPSLGQSISAGTSDQNKVEGITWADGKGFIVKIDATATEVEVII
jgi:hypothetical protein